MTRGTKKFLKDLNYLFKRGSDRTTFEVWNILTALRGPDDQDPNLKAATTEVIRRAVFGLNSKVNNNANVSPDKTWKVEARVKITNGHFKSHAVSAFEALGLDWNNYNE